MTKNICMSGGSKGADQTFGECAALAGHDVYHWSFGNHFSPCEASTIKILHYPQLMLADKHLVKANTIIKRTFPTRSEYVNNLLRRNFYQVSESERLYASTALNDVGIPYGGTAWAIVMGVELGIREMFVYDYNQNTWLSLVESKEKEYIWKSVSVTEVPRPYGIYAGIGSSELPDNGKAAILDLYENGRTE